MPEMPKNFLAFLAAVFFLWAFLPFPAGAADYAFAITHSRFQPRRGETAQISYTLTENVFTTITVYNLRGERAALLFSGFAQAGTHQLPWGGENGAGSLVASGAYIVQISAGAFAQTRKVVVVK